MTLASVSLTDNYFSCDNRSFIPIGAHWVPAKAALQWPHQWDEADIAADFAKMKDLGFNIVRFDLFWAWFEPRPGNYHSEAFRQFDFFVRMAHQHGIYLHPTLFIGNEVGEAYWDIPWRQGRHPHADPALLRLQTNHAAEFARRYRNEPAIFAWDLTDEPPFWIVADSTTDDMAVNWIRLISGALRRYDPSHLICVGTDVQDLSHGPFRPDLIAEEVDFFTAHPYPIYLPHIFPDPMLSERGTYCAAFQTILSSSAGKPTMIHELGASSAQYNPEKIAKYDQTAMYSALAAGAIGFVPWCYTDAAPETFHRVPYIRAPHETQFGLTTWDRKDRPAGKMFHDFGRIIAQLDLTGLQPAPAQAALIVPHEWAKPHGDFSKAGINGPEVIPYVSTQDNWKDDDENNTWLMGSLLSAFILARRAGLKVTMPREYHDWQSHSLVLLPSPLTGTGHNITHVHTTFWETARTYVKRGGALYASFCADAAIPEMTTIFGCSLSDHVSGEEVTLTLTTDFGGLTAGESFHFRADPSNLRDWAVTLDIHDGQVIAEDQDGRPALVTHALGAGKTLLSTYPLEHYLAVTPSAFEGQENAHRLYEALRAWAGIQVDFWSGNPKVETGAILGQRRAYVILINHSAAPQKTTVYSQKNLESASIITLNGKQPLKLRGNNLEMEMPAWDGRIVEINW